MSRFLVLIPSFEPETVLVDVCKSLKESDFDILIVDDGSDVSYKPIFDEASKYAFYQRLEKNSGKGNALKTGLFYINFLYSDHDYIITADGDGQHSIKDIKRMKSLLLKENEIVIGTRTFNKRIPFRSRFGNDLSKLTRGLITKKYLADDQCGLRGFPFRYINDLFSISGSRYEYEMNMIMSFQMKDYKLVTMPIETIYIEHNASSHFSPVKDTFKIQGVILSYYGPALINFVLSTVLTLCLSLLNQLVSPFLIVSFSMIGAFILSLFSLCFIYRSKNIKHRFKKEIFYFLFRFAIFMGFFALFYLVVGWKYILSSFFISYLISAFSNFFLSYIVGKIFKK